MGLRIRRIDNGRDFVALAPIWAELVHNSGQASLFLSHDWFWCCWHGVWPQRRPEILLIEEVGGPVAIVPLMHWNAWFHGLPVRYLGFLECPDTPLADILAVGDHSRVLETFVEHLTSRSDWDTACLQKLPARSPTLKTLEGILPGRLPWRRAGHLLYPYLAIGGDWERFYGVQDISLKDAYQRIQVRLERVGDLSLEEHRTVDLGSPLLQEALAVMGRSRRMDYSGAMATMPRTPEFLRELTRRAAKNGWLSLWSLSLNGHVLAIEYQLRADGKIKVLWAGGNPLYREFLPATALNLAILQSLFQSGYVCEYSLGYGVNGDHLWRATAQHETVHLQLYRPSLYSRLVYGVETAVTPWARRWHQHAGGSLP
jgi:CelD/BcsL family acetyltransferase involved in cellulose biosynthesis